MFQKLLDYFVHPSLKAEKSIYEKSKISIVVMQLSLLIVSIYTLFYTSQGFYSDIKAYHNYLGIVCLALGLVITKKFGFINLALSSISVLSLYLVSSSIYLSGGIQSNDIQWFLVISTSAFMFINYKNGIFITVLSLIAMTFFYFLDVYDLNYEVSNSVSLTTGYRYFNFSLILMLLSSMFFLLVKGNQRLQDIVQKSKEQEIRVEIARDFHDQIGNKLASLQHLTELIKLNKTATEKELILNKINDNAKEVYDNFRDFIWTLDVKSDSTSELFMYLRDFSDDFFRFSDVNIYTSSKPENLPNIQLPGRISKEIVPIFKEAITNIAKHAKAKNVYLSFELSANEFIILLKDDGLGFDFNSIKLGKGINNIKHRAEKSGGFLSIQSEVKSGTEIVFTVKLPQKGSVVSLGNS